MRRTPLVFCLSLIIFLIVGPLASHAILEIVHSKEGKAAGENYLFAQAVKQQKIERER